MVWGCLSARPIIPAEPHSSSHLLRNSGPHVPRPGVDSRPTEIGPGCPPIHFVTPLRPRFWTRVFWVEWTSIPGSTFARERQRPGEASQWKTKSASFPNCTSWRTGALRRGPRAGCGASRPGATSQPVIDTSLAAPISWRRFPLTPHTLSKHSSSKGHLR